MPKSAHSQRAHALLSASSAYRWLHCPVSAHLESQMPDVNTVYSLTGTRAHELAEEVLKHYPDSDSMRQVLDYALQMDAKLYQVTDHVQVVVDTLEQSQAPILLLEQKLDLTRWVPEGFGTGDVLIIDEPTLHIIDLKYGQGERVEAEDNPQLRLYALGAYDLLESICDIKEVRMTISQPRLNHISTEALSAKELVKWGNFIKPKAKQAYKGVGEPTTGTHCRFCKVRAICPARKKDYMELAKLTHHDVELMDNAQIAKLLPQIDTVEQFIKDIKAKALSELLKGNDISGYKLVEGKSNRKVADEQGLVSAMTANGIPEAAIYSRKLETLTNLEKLAGGKAKFSAFYEQFVEKPQGAPTLAPISDKRPAINQLDTSDIFD